MTKRAVLYARVSGDDRGNDGRNLESQLDMARQYALGKGYAIVEEIAEDDRGASGAAFELPGLDRARELAGAGGFDILIAREIDRLSRNLAKQLIVEEELKRAGVAIEYALAEYPDTPEGRLSKHIRATVAEYEREKIAERVTRGRQNKVKSGQVVTVGRVAYGYRRGVVNAQGDAVILAAREKAEGKGTLIPFEPEARVVRMIYEWYVRGDSDGRLLSLHEIGRKLEGVPTYGDLHSMFEGGRRGHWSKPRVAALIRNETYAGLWHFGRRNSRTKTTNPADHVLAVEVPAIVDRATWEAAQLRLKSNKANSPRNRQREYLLAGHVACGACGAKMHGITPHAEEARPTSYYRCPAWRAWGYAQTCDSRRYFRADQVEAAVWDWVSSVLSDPQKLELGLREYEAEQQRTREPVRTRLQIVDDLLHENRAQLDRLLDLYLAGDFPKEMLTERKGRLEATIRSLEKERIGLVAQLDTGALTPARMQGLQEFAATVRESFDLTAADFETKRALLQQGQVEVVLSMEDDQKVAHASFLIWHQDLRIESRTKYN